VSIAGQAISGTPLPTSTRFAVAVHILTALAVNPDRPVRSEDIAASASTNPVVIRRLLTHLALAGLTSARLGQGGGATLARAPEAITLAQVFAAVEEPALFAMHRTEPDRSCFVGRAIQAVLRPTTERAEQALRAELAAVTIADVARDVLARRGARAGDPERALV
jgi:Rrf2 family protein